MKFNYRLIFFSKSAVMLAFLALFYSNAFGQTAVLTSGKLLERNDFEEKDLHYKDFINNRGRASASSSFFTLENEAHIGFGVDRKDTYYYMVLKDYLNVIDIRRVSMEEKNVTDVELKYTVRIRDKNFLFYTERNKERKETIVYVNEMDDKDMLYGTPVKLLTISDETMKFYGDIHVLASENKRSLLIYQTSPWSPYIYKIPKPKIACYVMDENFGKVWEGDLDWTTFGKRCDLQDVKIDDEGNTYALVYTGKDDEQKASVFSYSWKKQKSLETVIGNRSDEAKTYGCRLEVVEGKDAIVAGLSIVSDQLSYFATRIDPNVSSRILINKSFSEPDRLLISKHRSEKGMRVQHITKTGNSDYVFSIEENTTGSSSGSNSTAFYYSNSIHLISVGVRGENWNKIISKKQVIAANPSLSSHALIKYQSNLYVFYNDVKTNFQSETDDSGEPRLYSGGNTVVVMHKINPAGEIVTQLVPTGQTDKFGINTDYFVKIRDGLYHTQLSATTLTNFACAYATIELK
jgi:hypothetical protein